MWSSVFQFQPFFVGDTTQVGVDSVFSVHLDRIAQPVASRYFWVVEDLWQWLVAHGFSVGWSHAITFLTLCCGLALAVWAVDFVILHFVAGFVKGRAQHSRKPLYAILYRRKFFDRVLYLVPLGVILFGIDLFFRGFAPALNLVARVATECVMIFTALLVCFSLLDALNDLYQRSPEAQKRSIKGYIQIGKILAAFVAGILIVADILQKNPTSLLVGLGAAAAVLSLVFRDTLLGFVASIQLSAQDMVRPGDWIEMPGKQADGMVLDINLNSVKVQNWDNTITMIPIYSMVSESFINWRGMERSGGRRFISRFYLDVDSVGLADEGMLARLSSDPSTAELAKATLELARSTSPDRLTNLALFRAHMEVWLFRNPKLNPRMLTFARYLAETSDRGIGLEIYAFTKNTENEYVFDTVKRSVTEHVIGCLPLFGLRLFQKPSAHSLNGILQTPKG